MEYYKSSFILSLIVRFWDYLTLLFRGSLLHRLGFWIRDAFRNGLLYRFFTFDGPFAAVWEESRFKKAVEWLFNLIPRLFRGIYRLLAPASEKSAALRVISGFHALAVAVIGLMMFALLVTPQEMWNNLYSLIFVAAAFILYFLAALGNGRRSISLSDIGVWPLLYFFVTFLSLLWSANFSMSLRFFFFSLTCLLLLILLVNALERTNQLISLITFCAIGLAVGCVYAVLQNRAGIEVDESLTDISVNAGDPGQSIFLF